MKITITKKIWLMTTCDATNRLIDRRWTYTSTPFPLLLHKPITPCVCCLYVAFNSFIHKQTFECTLVMGRAQNSSGSGWLVNCAFGFGLNGFKVCTKFRVSIGFGYKAQDTFRVRVLIDRAFGLTGFTNLHSKSVL